MENASSQPRPDLLYAIRLHGRSGGTFGASVNAASQTVTQGQTASYTITLQSQNGSSGAVSLTVLNLRGNQVLPGTGFSPQTVNVPANGTASSTLTIVTNGSTPMGTANMTVRAVNGSTTRTAAISLNVNAASVPTFTGSPTSGQQLTTAFTYTGTGLTPNGTIQQLWTDPNNSPGSGTIQANGAGTVNWTYTYKCTDAPGTWYTWIVDPAKNYTSTKAPNFVSKHPSCP